jgi:DtxR family Mn-dependent transcriptional regulator
MSMKTARRRQSDCCEIVHTEAVEDYLKVLFHLGTRAGVATTSALAAQLGVASPTVSIMLKRLEAADLVRRFPGHDVELTEHGTRHAVSVVRRHRLLEMFLAQVLDVPWDEVHAEAEVLEHALSPRLEERINALLGHPTHDPHGDPIPPASGEHIEDWGTALAAVPPGGSMLVQRVSDRDSSALRHLASLGIRPGTEVQVLERAPFGGPLWVQVQGGRHALGTELVQLLHGEVR